MSSKSLLVYSDRFERSKNFTDLEKTRDFLESRIKMTYRINGINAIELSGYDLNITFQVLETDDHLIKKGLPEVVQKFFISRYVWTHLAQFLGITTKTYDLIQEFARLPEDKRLECEDYLGQILKVFFNERMKEVEEKKKKHIYITVFSDGFGCFPRVIHSEIYYPYRDFQALTTILKGVELVNQQNADREYSFKSAEISPYRSKFNFTNYWSQTEVRKGETIESGFCVINSECKKASYNYQNYLLRLECNNGLTSKFTDDDLSVNHYQSGFEQKIQAGFVRALQLEDEFAQKYIDAVNYDQEISDDWADLLDIPSSILAMNNNEKEELIEIGRSKEYKFSPYGILNVLTEKATHRSHDDATINRINEKALKVLDKVEDLSFWQPKRLVLEAKTK